MPAHSPRGVGNRAVHKRGDRTRGVVVFHFYDLVHTVDHRTLCSTPSTPCSSPTTLCTMSAFVPLPWPEEVESAR